MRITHVVSDTLNYRSVHVVAGRRLIGVDIVDSEQVRSIDRSMIDRSKSRVTVP